MASTYADSPTLLQGYAAVLPSVSGPIPFQTTPTDCTNMSHIQQQLYSWHVHLGHMNFAMIQGLAHKGIGIPHELACCHPPMCHECQYGKAKQCSTQDPQLIGE